MPRISGLDGHGSGQGQVAGCCEHGNEPSGSKKCGKFLDYPRTPELMACGQSKQTGE